MFGRKVIGFRQRVKARLCRYASLDFAGKSHFVGIRNPSNGINGDAKVREEYQHSKFCDMPNWCSQDVVAVGDAQEVKSLYELMKELEELPQSRVDNGFGKRWMGNLVDAIGADWHDVGCRGSWSDLQHLEGRLDFFVDSAWAPLTEVFDLIEEKFQSVKVYYYAEEPGCGIFCSNDDSGKYFPSRFVVDINLEDASFEEEYFETLEDALEWISQKAGEEIRSEEELKAFASKLQDHDDEFYCYIHQIEAV